MADTIEIVVKADGRQALANLEKLRLALAGVDEKASTARARNELQALNRAWQLTHRELMSGMKLLGITGGLIGGGLVAGLVAGGRALADFSAQGLQLHYLSKELGVGAESLERWRLAGKAAGISSETAASDVQTAMQKIQDLGRRGGYSDLYKEMVASTADRTGHELAQALYAEIQAGGPEQGFRFMMQKLQQYSKEGNQWGVTTVEKFLGLRGKGWERSTDLIEKIGKVTVVSAEDAQKLQLNMTLLGLSVDNFTTSLGNELLPVFTALADRFNAWLNTTEGQEFQKSLIDTAKQLEKLPWEDIQKSVRTTMRVVIAIFTEGKRVIESFLWTFNLAADAYNKVEEFNRKKLRDERLSGVHGRNAQREEAARQKRWHPRSPMLPSPPKPLDPLLDKLFGKSGGSSGSWGGGNNTPQRFSGGGGGATDFSSSQRRTETTESLNDQMRDVTDEVRRLNDLLRGGGDVASTGGKGSAGNMGPTGSGSDGPGTTPGTTPGSTPGTTPPGSSTPYRPTGTTPATIPGSTASLGYEPGKFTPVKDLTTASGEPPTGTSQSSAAPTGDQGVVPEGRATWFHTGPPIQGKDGVWHDPSGEREGPPASGAPHSEPGIATPGRKGLGEWYEVVAPDGSVHVVRKTDIGPGRGPQSKGVTADINAALTSQIYTKPGEFKEKGWKIRHLGKNLPTGVTPGRQATTPITAKPITILKTVPTTASDAVPGAVPPAIKALDDQLGIGDIGKPQPDGTPAGTALQDQLGIGDIGGKPAVPAAAGPGGPDLSGFLGNKPITPASNPQQAVNPPGTSLVKESSLGDPNKIRNLKVPDATRNALEYAAQQTGLRVDIQSGGQHAHGRRRTGSHRHDVEGGGAADFDLYDEKGNKVPHSDPRALKFVEEAAAAGAGGGGAARSYMGDYRIHLGAGGKQAAYTGSKAFREALNRGVQRQATFDKTKLTGANPSLPAPKITTLNTKRNDDDDATRKVIDAGLINNMSMDKIKASANVNVDVTGATKSADAGDSDKDLFNTTRSKGAPQLPNTATNTKDDKSSASSEDE